MVTARLPTLMAVANGFIMRSSKWTLILVSVVLGCSSTTVTGSRSDGAGGNSPAGGNITAGGNQVTSSSGAPSLGGTTTAGTTSSQAGAIASGGIPTGGIAAVAGISSGGVTANAGSQAVVVGGAVATGGVTPGGGQSIATGGVSVAGGQSIATGGVSTGGVSNTSGGGAATGGVALGGSVTGGGIAGTATTAGAPSSSVAIAAGPWGDAATNAATVTVSVPALDADTYLLVALVANATEGTSAVSTSNVYLGSLGLTHLAGGNIAGTAFCSEFWGVRILQSRSADTLQATVSSPANIGMLAWSLAGTNPTNPVGTVLPQAQATVSLYQENFPSKRAGSMLFGAFFDGSYATGVNGYLPITASDSSIVAQTFAGYYAYSKSAAPSGTQSIGAILPDTWTIYHAALEVVP